MLAPAASCASAASASRLAVPARARSWCPQAGVSKPLGSCSAVVAGLVSFAFGRTCRRAASTARSSRSEVSHDFVAAVHEPDKDYLPIIVQMPDGEQYQIEVRPIDTVAVMKVVLALEMSWDENFVEVLQDGERLEHETVLKDIGLKEGSFFVVEYAEEEANEAIALKNSAPEGHVRITVVADRFSGDLRHTVDVPEDALVKDVKKQVYAHFATKIAILRESLTADDFYLFQLLKSKTDFDGHPRQKFFRDERVHDVMTIKEAGVDGKRELHLMHTKHYKCCEMANEDNFWEDGRSQLEFEMLASDAPLK
eukprot:CAMPEP_0197660948 /NCGR_PEP_ID=MMETSP1338-20131121/51159_1 /TAXON_ID=43686 ORGANISM="Pelagodinium beii, Strain RCC1491" /NCGR_SAMPLE_ID=MMETSP1338 /ASSEMBLY_ACC=CAM_ASM_000754 /LENGTH=309 /DNA_ID=CAMNT_0043238407 /DNA_START=75 /DNA_END=1001 /DNA_ORIENTATION=-